MTIAALQAIALRECLAKGDGQLARRFFRAAAKPISVAWQLAVGGDLALPETRGDRPRDRPDQCLRRPRRPTSTSRRRAPYQVDSR
jgi:hypothetical protein